MVTGTPLHSLCQNALATEEMLLALASAEPSCISIKDSAGNTPLVYLMGGQQVASQSAVFDEISEGVKLVEGKRRAVSAGENVSPQAICSCLVFGGRF